MDDALPSAANLQANQGCSEGRFGVCGTCWRHRDTTRLQSRSWLRCSKLRQGHGLDRAEVVRCFPWGRRKDRQALINFVLVVFRVFPFLMLFFAERGVEVCFEVILLLDLVFLLRFE